jgi:hypothetical protein
VKAAIANEATVLRCWAEWFVGCGDAFSYVERHRCVGVSLVEACGQRNECETEAVMLTLRVSRAQDCGDATAAFELEVTVEN